MGRMLDTILEMHDQLTTEGIPTTTWGVWECLSEVGRTGPSIEDLTDAGLRHAVRRCMRNGNLNGRIIAA